MSTESGPETAPPPNFSPAPNMSTPSGPATAPRPSSGGGGSSSRRSSSSSPELNFSPEPNLSTERGPAAALPPSPPTVVRSNQSNLRFVSRDTGQLRREAERAAPISPGFREVERTVMPPAPRGGNRFTGQNERTLVRSGTSFFTVPTNLYNPNQTGQQNLERIRSENPSSVQRPGAAPAFVARGGSQAFRLGQAVFGNVARSGAGRFAAGVGTSLSAPEIASQVTRDRTSREVMNTQRFRDARRAAQAAVEAQVASTGPGLSIPGDRRLGFNTVIDAIPGGNFVLDRTANAQNVYRDTVREFYLKQGSSVEAAERAAAVAVRDRSAREAGGVVGFVGLSSLSEIAGRGLFSAGATNEARRAVAQGATARGASFTNRFTPIVGAGASRAQAPRTVAGIAARSSGMAGVLEGAGGVFIEAQADARIPTPQQIVYGGAFGAVSAGTAGAAIAGTAVAGRRGASRALSGAFNIADPYELPGDIIGGRTAGLFGVESPRITSVTPPSVDVVIGSGAPRGGRRSRPPVRTLDPSFIIGGPTGGRRSTPSPTPTQAQTRTQTRINNVVRTFVPTFTPTPGGRTSPTPTPTPSQTPGGRTPVPTPGRTPTQVPAFTPTNTPTFTPVPIPISAATADFPPPFPPFLSPGALGGGSGRGARRGGVRFYNELAETERLLSGLLGGNLNRRKRSAPKKKTTKRSRKKR